MDMRLLGARDFVNQIASGGISLRNVIPTKSPMGNQVNYMEFPEYSQKICERDGLDRLSLYRAIQQAINHGNLQRINRSPIFKQKLESVMGCDEGDDRCISEMFEDRIETPYDQRYFHRERQGVEDLYRRLQDIEALMGSDEGPDDSVRPMVSALQGDCQEMKGRLNKQKSILEENGRGYQPTHSDAWTRLSLKPFSFYKEGHANPDKPYPAIVDKQLGRHVTDKIQQVFDNGLIMPHYLSAENKRLLTAIDAMLSNLEPGPSVAHMERNLKEIMDLLPSEASGISELQKFWNAIVRPSSSDEDSSEDGSDDEDLAELENKVIHLSKGPTPTPTPAPTKPSDSDSRKVAKAVDREIETESDNDEDEGGEGGEGEGGEEGEEDPQQTGGQQGKYYLEVDQGGAGKRKASFF